MMTHKVPYLCTNLIFEKFSLVSSLKWCKEETKKKNVKKIGKFLVSHEQATERIFLKFGNNARSYIQLYGEPFGTNRLSSYIDLEI